MGFLNRLIDFLKVATPQKRMTVVAMLLILTALPLTVIVAQQQQELRQHAATPSPTPPPGSTALVFNLGLDAFSSTDPSKIKDSLRHFIIQLRDKKGNVVSTQNTNLTFNKSTKKFTGSLPLPPALQNSDFNLSIQSPGYFQSTTTQILSSLSGKTKTVSLPDLTAGDIDGDDESNILDFNTLLSCSIFSKDNSRACNDKTGRSLKTAADLNGDGEVDQDDYTILLRNLKERAERTTSPCTPRPACLDTNPRCLIAEPAAGWCPNQF